MCLLLQLVIGGSFGGVVPDLEEDGRPKVVRPTQSNRLLLLPMPFDDEENHTLRFASELRTLDSLLQPKRRFDQEMKAHLATEYDVPIELNHLLGTQSGFVVGGALNQRALQRQCVGMMAPILESWINDFWKQSDMRDGTLAIAGIFEEEKAARLREEEEPRADSAAGRL